MYSPDNPGAQGQQPTPSGQWQQPGRTFTLGDALAVGGGLLVFAFSFLPFVAYDDDLKEALFLESRDLETWFNAWEAETFMAPLTWFAIVAALLVAVLALVRYFTGAQRRFLTFTLPQLQVALAMFATVVLLGYATASRSVVFGTELAEANGNGSSMYYTDGLDLGLGGYLMLVFALLAAVGSFLALYGAGPTLISPRASGGHGGQGAGYQRPSGGQAPASPTGPATTEPPAPASAESAPATPPAQQPPAATEK